jgi:hypothetical protein
MIDHVRDIKEAIEGTIQNYLGPSYKLLAYVQDVAKNNYNTNSERYGVRALAGGEVPGVTKTVQLTQTFEVVLSKSYRESSLDDSEQSEKALDNFNNMLSIYKDLVNTKCGAPAVVLNVFNLQMPDPEYMVDSKVAIQRATMDITYRFSLI